MQAGETWAEDTGASAGPLLTLAQGPSGMCPRRSEVLRHSGDKVAFFLPYLPALRFPKQPVAVFGRHRVVLACPGTQDPEVLSEFIILWVHLASVTLGLVSPVVCEVCPGG